MWHGGAKIMKCRVLSGYVGKILAEAQNQAELLDRYSLTRVSENNSKSCFIGFIDLHHFNYLVI